MKKIFIVNILVLASTFGCVNTQSLMKDYTKETYGNEAFQEPNFSNPHYNEQYATYKKLAAQFKDSGKIPVNWDDYEKCDFTNEEAANIIEPKPDSETLAMMAKFRKKAKKSPKGSLAKQANAAQYSSSKNSSSMETILVLAEIYALKGHCGSADEISKSTSKQIRRIVNRTKSTTTVYVFGKKNVSSSSVLIGRTSLRDLKAMGASSDIKEIQEMHARKKLYPWEGWAALNVSLSKTEKSSFIEDASFLAKAMASDVYDASKTFTYSYNFNNGNSIIFFDLGGSTNTSIKEYLSDKRIKSLSYKGSKLASVMRMKGFKRHGLQEDHAKGKGHQCFVAGTKSYKTDCEVF